MNLIRYIENLLCKQQSIHSFQMHMEHSPDWSQEVKIISSIFYEKMKSITVKNCKVHKYMEARQCATKQSMSQ